MINYTEAIYDHPLKKTVFGEVVESNVYGPRFNANDYDLKGNVKTIRGTDLGYSGELKYSQIPTAKIDQKTVETHKLEDGDLVVITTADCGMTAVFREQNFPYIASAYAVRVRLNKKGNSDYFKYYFQTHSARKEISKYVRKATVANLPGSDLLRLKINLPYLSDQQKIADFLSAVDKKISLLKEKHALLEQYKKGVMQKLFSQAIRFKDENGNNFPDWQKGTLGDLSNKVSNKNKDETVTAVLTNSAKSGIVNQTDYFKKDIANENNLGGYSIVEKNDFVYNPRISVLAPVGPIKRNHVGQGVMSPLYTVFRFKNENIFDYLELYFETTQWHRYMNSIANFGARHDRMNITMGDFFNLPIPIPSQEEMVKIVGFINSLNKKVELVSQQIAHTQTFKKGLLQQMFV